MQEKIFCKINIKLVEQKFSTIFFIKFALTVEGLTPWIKLQLDINKKPLKYERLFVLYGGLEPTPFRTRS